MRLALAWGRMDTLGDRSRTLGAVRLAVGFTPLAGLYCNLSTITFPKHDRLVMTCVLRPNGPRISRCPAETMEETGKDSFKGETHLNQILDRAVGCMRLLGGRGLRSDDCNVAGSQLLVTL